MSFTLCPRYHQGVSPSSPISRRDLFVTTATTGGAALALSAVVAACGGDSKSAPDTSVGAFVMSPEIAVVKRFPDGALIPGEVRLPISLANTASILSGDDLPNSITGKIVNLDSGEIVQDALTATKHQGKAPTPYWPFIATINEPGLYKIVVDGANPEGAGMQISPADQVALPVPGDQLPSVVTPTLSNPMDMDPMCTLTPNQCPLHGVSVDEALKLNKPVVYLIGTPAHCVTGTCAPALEYLVEIAAEFRDRATFIHTEVYKDKGATEVTPSVSEYFMTFEPALFITDSTGVLRVRLDSTFDDAEIRAALKTVGLS
jgi:hypothetical protein